MSSTVLSMCRSTLRLRRCHAKRSLQPIGHRLFPHLVRRTDGSPSEKCLNPSTKAPSPASRASKTSLIDARYYTKSSSHCGNGFSYFTMRAGDASPGRTERRRRLDAGCRPPNGIDNINCRSNIMVKQLQNLGRDRFARAVGVGLPERSEPAGPQGAERTPSSIFARL